MVLATGVEGPFAAETLALAVTFEEVVRYALRVAGKGLAGWRSLRVDTPAVVAGSIRPYPRVFILASIGWMYAWCCGSRVALEVAIVLALETLAALPVALIVVDATGVVGLGLCEV